MQGSFDLNGWSHHFISSVLAKNENIDIKKAKHKLDLGHPDILIIEKDKKNKEYHVDNPAIEEMFRHQSFTPTHLNRHFIIFKESQLISTSLANKLLKILEEPQKNTSIFFLNDGQRPMLSTIESRAITLRHPYQADSASSWPSPPKDGQNVIDYVFSSLKDNGHELPSSVLRAFENHNDIEVVDYFNKNHQAMQSLILILSEYMCSPNIALKKKKLWLKEVKHYQESLVFHNYPSERLLGLIHASR